VGQRARRRSPAGRRARSRPADKTSRPLRRQFWNLTLDVGIRWGTTGASPDVTFLAGITLAFSGGETPGGHPHDERETPGRGAGRQDRRQWTRCIFPTDI
jgi:hypothetical protein